MPGYEEEIFGPVALIFSAKNEKEAIRIANDSPFGLGAAVFTANVKHGEELAAKSLNAGSWFVNSMVKSDPRLPFGGINQSGYGRELSAFWHQGICKYQNGLCKINLPFRLRSSVGDVHKSPCRFEGSLI
jgi:acyl-CoA reductase-like NAD-dependent aldehyde dehydrogenase